MEEGEAPRTVEVDGMELHLDPEPDANGEVHTALPPRMEAWRRRSAAGAILTGIGLGLKAALEPERDEPSIILQTAGTPPSDLPVEADMGGILPGDKVVRIRPWLLEADARAAIEKALPAADPAAPAASLHVDVDATPTHTDDGAPDAPRTPPGPAPKAS